MDSITCTSVTLMELHDRICRWPVSGSGADTRFCGAPKLLNSYCSKHAIKAIGRGTPAERQALKVLERAAL